MDSCVRTFEEQPLLAAETADRAAVESETAEVQEKLRTKERIDKEYLEISKKVQGEDIDTESASEQTKKLDEERAALGRIAAPAWNAWRKVQAWDFLRTEKGLDVPQWAYAAEGVSTNAALVVGPCVILLRVTTLLLLATRILAFTAKSVGFERNLIWTLVIPGLCMSVFSDIKATRHFMLAYLVRVDAAEINGFMLFGVIALPLKRLWVWRANTFQAGILSVLQNISVSVTAATFFSSVHGSEVFEAIERLPGIKFSFFAAWCVTNLNFLYAAVTTCRKQELPCNDPDSYNVLGKSGGGSSLAGEQYNDDVMLALAESAGAGGLQSMSIKFASAHVKTTPAVELAVKTANSLAWRVGGSLLLLKLPLCAMQLLQVLLFQVGIAKNSELGPGEVVVLLNMGLGVPLSMLHLLTIKDFGNVVKLLDRRVDIARKTGEWEQTAGAALRVPYQGQGPPPADQVLRERQRAYCRVHVLLWFSRFCGLLLVLAACSSGYTLVNVVLTHRLPKIVWSELF